jgi:hyperosmotically inducible periplasmic protein
MTMNREVSALHIKVDTENNGVVTLSGKAKSQEEADKAVSIARAVEGVVSVENNIQIAAHR